MGVNRVELSSGEVLIDLRQDSITPDALESGVTAHNAAGNPITGEFTLDEELTAQDYLIDKIIKALTGKGGSGGGAISIVGENLHDTAADTANAYLSNGVETAYNNWAITDYIPVEAGKHYLVYSTGQINGVYCARYDSDKAFITNIGGQVNCTDKNNPLFLSGHDGYIRISAIAAQVTAYEIYEVSNFDWKA